MTQRLMFVYPDLFGTAIPGGSGTNVNNEAGAIMFPAFDTYVADGLSPHVDVLLMTGDLDKGPNNLQRVYWQQNLDLQAHYAESGFAVETFFAPGFAHNSPGIYKNFGECMAAWHDVRKLPQWCIDAQNDPLPDI